MDDYNNKSICVLPWINISTNTEGNVRLCCLSDAYIKKENGTNYNLGYDKLDDIINSASFKKVRQDMIDGIPISGCEKCYIHEKNNGRSERQGHNKIWGPNLGFRSQYKKSLNNGDIDPIIQYVDLRFGNLCNLSCRSCYGGASSQFNKEMKELVISQPSVLKFHGVFEDHNDWYTTDVFNKNVLDQLPNLKQYYCVGGEPTLIDKNYEILQKMITTGDSKHTVLVISTNMTNTKKDFYSLFQHFKKVILLASIDGVNGMQEYLRYPSDWGQISGNLHKVINMNLPNVFITVSPVVQKTNLGYITELFDYFEDINKKHDRLIIQIHPIPLIDPDYLNLKYLPLDYKAKCWEKIDEWIRNSCKYQKADFHQRMKPIKNSCFEEVEYQQSLADYFEFTDIFDKNRNERLADVNPDLDSLRR